MRPTVKRFRIRSILALVGLAIVATACTSPAGAGSPDGGASAAPAGASAAPSVATPTKGGYGSY